MKLLQFIQKLYITASNSTPPMSVIIVSMTLVIAGGLLQGLSNGTIHSVFVSFLFLYIGIILIGTIFHDCKPEMRAFLLTYGVCVFVGGLAQCYSLTMFNNPQSTLDSFTFFQKISSLPPFTTIKDVSDINAPLAVLIWQQVYKLTWWLGIKFGPYIGVIFNAFVMGLSGCLTVKTAREIFGNDNWRLQRIGALFTFCGLFILFGSILIRDCFTTFFNILVFWGIIRWLVKPSIGRLFFGFLLTVVSAYAMVYLRILVVLLFGIYWCSALLFWFMARRLNAFRLLTGAFAMCVLLVGVPYLLTFFEGVQQIQSKAMINYLDEGADRQVADDSLGMKFVVDQPLPVRMILGSGALMINPIPIWRNFTFKLGEYHWIKGYNGIYQIIILPLVFLGFMAIPHVPKENEEIKTSLRFLVVYMLINLAAVVATSLEQRHIAQFLPALIILAALPDTRDMIIRNKLRKIMTFWVMALICVHLAWAMIKV
jgi:hypothetical protein